MKVLQGVELAGLENVDHYDRVYSVTVNDITYKFGWHDCLLSNGEQEAIECDIYVSLTELGIYIALVKMSTKAVVSVLYFVGHPYTIKYFVGGGDAKAGQEDGR